MIYFYKKFKIILYVIIFLFLMFNLFNMYIWSFKMTAISAIKQNCLNCEWREK